MSGAGELLRMESRRRPSPSPPEPGGETVDGHVSTYMPLIVGLRDNLPSYVWQLYSYCAAIYQGNEALTCILEKAPHCGLHARAQGKVRGHYSHFIFTTISEWLFP